METVESIMTRNTVREIRITARHGRGSAKIERCARPYLAAQTALLAPSATVARCVKRYVFASLDESKILDSIIRSVSVHMMNMLACGERSAEKCLHDDSVLKPVLAFLAIPHHAIARVVEKSALVIHRSDSYATASRASDRTVAGRISLSIRSLEYLLTRQAGPYMHGYSIPRMGSYT